MKSESITRKLFYEDACLQSCRATVCDCRRGNDRYEIVLDQTCFYPEGGGQPGDTGRLNDIAVFDTHEKDGYVLHYTKESLAPGTAVTATIDWDRRFDLMQQHSGEHMISGVIHRCWGYENVGFHMGADRITIDLSGVLTPEQLMEVEEEVNRAIWQNAPVHIWYPSPEELSEIPYRSKKALSGAVRLVEFPDTDICACCGTHVDRTGAIGLVKILDVEKFHAGIRVELVCGNRAARYLGSVFTENQRISRLLSAKPLQTADAVSALSAEAAAARRRVHALEDSLFAAKAAELYDAGDVVVFFNDLDPDGVRRACDAIQQTCGGRTAVFSGTDDSGYAYAVGLPGGDLRAFTQAMNTALHGRGGGKPPFVQGRVSASEDAIRAFFSAAGSV